MSDKTSASNERHLKAIESILAKDEITLTPDNVVNLLAYLQATRAFQNHVILALASVAAGKANWDEIEQLGNEAELSDRILERLIAKLSGLEAAP